MYSLALNDGGTGLKPLVLHSPLELWTARHRSHIAPLHDLHDNARIHADHGVWVRITPSSMPRAMSACSHVRNRLIQSYMKARLYTGSRPPQLSVIVVEWQW